MAIEFPFNQIDPELASNIPIEPTGPTGNTGSALTAEQIAENERAYQRQQDAAALAAEKQRQAGSAYNLLLSEFI